MEALNKPMSPPQFCPLCAKKGKKTKILPLSINLSVGVNMCISVKCTYPFGEYVITELPSPSRQELSKIIQEVTEENKGITDEDIISSVENRQIPKIDENIYYPDIDDSFILQQLNQHLDTGISEYPNTNHLVDNETLADDTTHILTNTKEEISYSPNFDQLVQKPFNQKNVVAMNVEISDFPNTNNLVDSETLGCNTSNLLTDTVEEISISNEFHQQRQMPKEEISYSSKFDQLVQKPFNQKNVVATNVEISDLPNTNNLVDSETLGCNKSNLLTDTVEEISISNKFHQQRQMPCKRKNKVAINMPMKRKTVEDMDIEVSELPNTNSFDESETSVCDMKLLLPNTVEESSISTKFSQPTQKTYKGNTAFAMLMRKKRKVAVLTSPNNPAHGNGEPDFLNKITEQYMGDVSNFAGFIKASCSGTPLKSGNTQFSEDGITEQTKLKDVAIAEDDAPNNHKSSEPTEEVVELPEKIVESIANVQSITEIFQPNEKVVQSITEIAQPIESAFSIVVLKDENVTQPYSVVVQKDDKVTQPFSIVVQNVEKVVEPLTEKVQSLEKVFLTKAKAAQLREKVDILKKNKKLRSKSNIDTFVEESDSDLEIVEIPKVPNKNKKCESNLKLLSLSRRHTVLKRSTPRGPTGPTRFL